MLFVMLACSGAEEEEVEAPTVEWLAPADGDTLAAGDTNASLVVDGLVLTDAAKHAEEGTPEGYVVVSVDGTEVLTTAEVVFTLTLEAGTHELDAALYYTDGDAITSMDGALCEEDAGCDPVAATITVNVAKDGID